MRVDGILRGVAFAVAALSGAGVKRSVFAVACFAAFIFSLLVGIGPLFLPSEASAQTAAPTCKTPAVRARIADLKARIERYRHRIYVLDTEIRPIEKRLAEQTKAAIEKTGKDHDANTSVTGFELLTKQRTREQLEKSLDGLMDELDKLESLPDCKAEAPLPPQPVKLYSVGTLHKPAPEVRQEIGDARMGGPHIQLASWTGPFVGAQFAYSSSSVTTSEFFAATGMRTNRFDDTGSGFGGGVNFGYNWQPWGNSVVVGAVFDINALNDSVRHDFPGGNYIGSVVNFTGSALVRGGVLVTPNVLLFGQGGVSIAKQQLKIDFGGPETNESQWTPGFTLGFGGEWKLPAPVLPISKGTSVFVDYKRTWWSTANLTMPAASPFFNYGWQRQTDGIDIGLRFRW